MHHPFETAIRAQGTAIDPPFAKALYAAEQAESPRGQEPVRDIAYGSDERHRLDLYPPVTAGSRLAPVVIFLHGGGFIRGDKADRAAVGHFFSRHGVLAILPSGGVNSHFKGGVRDGS